MRKTKLYSWESNFDFGQCNGENLKKVFEKSPTYISWCFQKLDWFCVTDDVFESLPIVISLKKDSDSRLKILTDKHSAKKKEISLQ